MELMTKVNIEPAEDKITYNHKILMMGSCFADEIGSLLKEYAFQTLVNPFGTLYNPVSVISSLERVADCREFTPDEVINTGLHHTVPVTPAAGTNPAGALAETESERPGKYCSLSHHSSFARETPQQFLEHANTTLRQASHFFKQADTVIITLGTAWVFRHIIQNRIVSNCHKINPKEFNREFLNITETAEILNKFVTQYPGKKFIFTVSPIRHLKDGAHGNQISKATLMLAIEKIIKSGLKNISYFPAYEIVLDELRDYRFYAQDMVHPSNQAVKYIFERFKEHFISPDEYQKMQENLKRHKQSIHRSIIQ